MTLAEQGIGFGAFTPVRAGGDQLECLNLLEQTLGRRIDVQNTFRKWGAPSGDFALAKIALMQVATNGRTPMITWEPLKPDSTQGTYTLDAMASGIHDSYIRTWAVGLRDLKVPFVIRLMHEMNGNWYPWSGEPAKFVKVWRQIVNIFRQENATNVSFAWCVNTSDQPKGNSLESYWPGRDYVDILGIDGYNCYSGWRRFGDIVRNAYNRVCALDPDLPVWICETATGEGNPALWTGTSSTSKPEWIRDLFATEGLSRVKMLMWLDEKNPASYDWRIDTSPASRQELSRQLRDAAGWVAPPGPYVPPVPDRIAVLPDGPGSVQISWRQLPSFYRGCYVYADGNKVAAALKPATTTRVSGLTPGKHSFTVSSYTLVRISARSAPVESVVL